MAVYKQDERQSEDEAEESTLHIGRSLLMDVNLRATSGLWTT